MILLIIGVSGSGKSTIGELLASKIGFLFVDADNFHSDQNINKMRVGNQLNDADRIPWLIEINLYLKSNKDQNIILACSALKKSYRKLILQEIDSYQLIYLKGEKEMIRQRVRARDNHFMPDSLLDSQFAILEEPRDSLEIDISNDVSFIVDKIIKDFKL